MKLRYKKRDYLIKKSNRKGKKLLVITPEGNKIHFADSKSEVKPGTPKGDSYCSRSYGIAKKYNIIGNESTPNFWSRFLWSCNKDKSVSKSKFKR